MASENTTDILRVGALHCPVDKEPLHFRIFQGMRIRQDGKYDARCPKCGKHYEVNAPKEPT